MQAYRLCSARWADSAFSGEGAKRYGGRWNHPGTPMVYCAGSLSLALLEMIVHVEVADLPTDFVVFRVEVEDEHMRSIETTSLPADWRRVPAPLSLQELGTTWARTHDSLGLRVPSAVVPNEYNLLLNPRHPDFEHLRRGAPENFSLDPRLRSGL